MTQRPTEQDAIEIVHSTLQREVGQIRRFPTGGYHYVYDIATDTGPVVVRIAHAGSQAVLAGGVNWSGILRSKGVPIPALLASNLSARPFLFMVLERLPGVDRVRHQAAALESELAEVQPTAFLDDTTTKNVIIHNGNLSGIVDTDFVCYGDPLWTVGLTRMALLLSGDAQDYIAAWTDLLDFTRVQERLLQFYTAVFCVDFMSEIGAAAGNENQAATDAGKAEQLAQILDKLLL